MDMGPGWIIILVAGLCNLDKKPFHLTFLIIIRIPEKIRFIVIRFLAARSLQISSHAMTEQRNVVRKMFVTIVSF